MILRCLHPLYIFYLCIFLPTTLGQFEANDGMRADLTFGDQNDRFDISNIIMEQNRAYRENPEDYRRYNDEVPLVEVIRNHRKRFSKHRSKSLRRNEDFAYHDSMYSDTNSNEDYEKNLKEFKTMHRRGLQIIDWANFVADTKANKRTSAASSVTTRRGKENVTNFRANRKSLQDLILNYLHREKTSRRNGDTDNILLKYAAPVSMKVSGYINVP